MLSVDGEAKMSSISDSARLFCSFFTVLFRTILWVRL